MVWQPHEHLRMHGNAVAQKWYLLALLTIVLYSTRLALLLKGYIQQLDCLL